MQLVIIRHENSLNMGGALNELHPLFQSQHITGRGEGIPLQGGIGQNGHLKQMVPDGLTGPGIQYMMIKDAILFKIPFIIAGGHHRFVRYRECQQGFTILGKGPAHPDAKISDIAFPVRLSAYCQNISP